MKDAMTGRERALSFLRGEGVDHLCLMPITMMFAADQVNAEYGRYAVDHRVLVEAQQVTAERFGFDHVSGITETREAPDCGAPVRFFRDQPYALDETRSLLSDKERLCGLEAPDPLGYNLMHDRIRGLSQLKEAAGAEKLVEGWVEGPCGAAADLRGINRLMLDFYDDPGFVRRLFDFVLELGVRFAQAQVEAGADLIGIGDPAASLVGPKIYREFVFPYERRLVDGIHAAGGLVRLHICGDIRHSLAEIGQLGCDMVDIDWAVPIAEARRAMGADQVLSGGIDPVRVIRDGTPQMILEALEDCHRQASPRYIVAAGCEIPRDTPAENMRAMTRYARTHQP